MRVTINYFGQLGQLAGKASEDCECGDRMGLRELLCDLGTRYGGDFGRMVMDDTGRPRLSLLIAVNGEAVREASFPALKDGDQVTLLPPLAGG
jgi:MoaD family protein